MSDFPSLTPLDALSSLMRQAPSLEELDQYQKELQELAQQIRAQNPESSDAQVALQRANAGSELLRQVRDLSVNEAKLTEASHQEKLKDVYELIIALKGFPTRLEDAKYKDHYPNITDELIQRARSLESRAVDIRKKFMTDKDMTMYLTGVASGEHESSLNSLYNLEKKGWQEAEDPDNPEIMIPIYAAIEKVRTRYRDWCENKATEKQVQAKLILQEKQEETYAILALVIVEEGIRLLNPDVLQTSGLENEQDVKSAKIDLKNRAIWSTLQDLKKRVEKEVEAYRQAETWVYEAHTKEPIYVMQAYDRLSFKRLSSLAETLSQVQENYKAIWRGKADDAHAQAKTWCSLRRYLEGPDSAKAALDTVQASFSTQPEPYRSNLLKEIEEKLASWAQAVIHESDEWKAFQEFQKELETAIKEGTVGQRAVTQLDTAIRGEWGTFFKSELETLQRKVTVQAGDRAVLEKAKSLFAHNPADPEIARLLAPDEYGHLPIPPSSKLFAEAEILLKAHYAHKALQDAETNSRDFRAMTDDVSLWGRMLTQSIAAFRENAKTLSSMETLTQRSQALDEIREKLIKVGAAVETSLRQNHFSEALAFINPLIVPAQQGTPVDNGYRAWKHHVLHTWRNRNMKRIEEVLAFSTPDLDELAEAAHFAQELEAHQALLEDGDRLKADRILGRWHLQQANHLLEKPLDSIDEQIWRKEISPRSRAWKELLLHLNGILATRAGDGNIQANTYRLRLWVLSQYGLQAETKEGIQTLEDALQQMKSLSDAPGVYAALALRHLENNNQPKATEIVKNLHGIGLKAQEVARGLQKMLEAYKYYGQQNIQPAIQALEAGLHTLVTALPEMESPLKQQVENTTLAWYQKLGDEILQTAESNARKLSSRKACSLEEFFELWRSAKQAARYLPFDPRLDTIRNALNKHVRLIGKKLRENTENLLDKPENALAARVQECQRVVSYLDLTTKEEELFIDLPGEDWLELHSRYPDLLEEQKAWENAWNTMQEVQKKWVELLSLEKPSWSWNSNGGETPNRDIRQIRTMLEEARNDLHGDQPSDLKQLSEFLARFQRATTELTAAMGTLKQTAAAHKYEQALQELGKLRIKSEEHEDQLNEISAALGKVDFSIDLQVFYVLDNPYRPLKRDKDGQWKEEGVAETIRGISRMEEYLEIFRKSRDAWAIWKTTTLELLVQKRKDARDARSFLTRRPGLSKAYALCRLVPHPENLLKELLDEQGRLPRTLQKLYAQIQVLEKMEPPRSSAAHKIALPAVDEWALEENSPIERHWKPLTDARRIETPALWRNYLHAEIAQTLWDLGPVPNDPLTTDALPATWQGCWNSQIEAFRSQLPERREPTLEVLLQARLDKFTELAGDRGSILEFIRRTAQVKYWNPGTQEKFQELLHELMGIDDAAPRIEAFEEEYKRREQTVTQAKTSNKKGR